MRKAIAVAVAVSALTLVGAAPGLVAPALACGDAPGLCPNPPDDTSTTGSDGGWVQGTGGDF